MNSRDRRYSGPLPFGQTEITASEAREQVDVEAATELVREAGVAEPERVEKFIDSYPSLLNWLEANGREYSWRGTTNPWKVYVAEILLQRTRGDMVQQIYDDFISEYPDPAALVDATEEEIRGKVYSLGFVNHRVRTLTDVATIFCEEYDCTVPDDLEALKRPWRVGDYSARACQLFARGEPLGLVDANFARVIGRVLGYEMPTQPHKSKEVYRLLQALTPANPALARAFNLSILDLGALVCKPKSPNCTVCPINTVCIYYSEKIS